jgi:hypothetical protein
MSIRGKYVVMPKKVPVSGMQAAKVRFVPSVRPFGSTIKPPKF